MTLSYFQGHSLIRGLTIEVRREATTAERLTAACVGTVWTAQCRRGGCAEARERAGERGKAAHGRTDASTHVRTRSAQRARAAATAAAAATFVMRGRLRRRLADGRTERASAGAVLTSPATAMH